MPIDTRNAKILAAAKAAIKAGNLAKAQEYLLMAEGEEAERLLERVNKAIAARGTAPKEAPIAQVTSAAVAEGIKQADAAKKQEKAKQQGYALIISLVLIFSCCGWLGYLGQPKPLENLEKMCGLVTSVGFKCDPQQIMRDYPDAVNYCQTTYGNFVNVEDLKYTWQNCLRSRGVEFQVDN